MGRTQDHQANHALTGERFSGLYNAAYEHDACGVGMVVNIHGNKSHELVDNALRVLENMRHRGAEGADNKTGDGAGIMLQIPHEFILLQGIPVPEKGKYGTGLVFLPKDEKKQQEILSIMIEEIEREGLSLMHLRSVPTNPECLGVSALETEPAIKQVFITGVTDDKVPTFERTLYIIRKKIENRIKDKDFYICSLSSRNIVYKGMLSSMQVRQYYPHMESGSAVPPLGTQWRDKHHPRQPFLVQGSRECALKRGIGRHSWHFSYHTAQHVRLGKSRQCV